MFDWLGDIFSGMGEAFSNAFGTMSETLANSIFTSMLQWLYKTTYDAIADFFQMMGNMGAEIFDLPWIEAIVKLVTLFGWALFVAGIVVAVFDLAIEYQSGKANPQALAINVLKGFFACSLIGPLPIELYKFCISLQNTLSHDLSVIYAGEQYVDFSKAAASAVLGVFGPGMPTGTSLLFLLLCLIAFAYCVIKVFFQNIKRGGILLVQISVGALYMFSVPRGYDENFVQWIKQVIAICLTAFMQTTLLYLGLMTFQENMLLGLGVMLAANEVPRIAQQFGLDSSVKMNMMSVVHASSTIVNLSRTLAKR